MPDKLRLTQCGHTSCCLAFLLPQHTLGNLSLTQCDRMPYPPAFPLLQHTLGDLSLTQPLDEFKDCPLYLGGDVGGGEVHMIHPYNLPRSVEVVKVRAGLIQKFECLTKWEVERKS
eukprot:1146365-Pelagomonas_calceolata.AAC.3